MERIKIDRAGPVRTVTLARPEKRNAIDPEMMQAIRAAFALEPPPDERVTVLRGEGSAFCAGLELAVGGVDPAQAFEIEAMFDALQRYPLPTVAVVQGPAIAGGCELALHCDFVVAANDARFAMPLAQIGVTTTWFLTKKMMEACGAVTAREFLLLGDPLTGRRLHELGIVSRAVVADELDAAAGAIVERLAANAPMAMRTMKAMIVKQGSFLMDIDHAEFEVPVREVFASEDAREGVAAKVGRRRPAFKGK